MGLVAVAAFMQMLDSTIVNTALPAIAANLGESPLRMQAVVIAYGLAMAMVIPASGWIADRFGTRKAFLGAIIVFTTGSFLCARSTTLGALVASRALQGIGGAMLMPVGRLALIRVVPRSEFLRAMTIVTIPGLIGPLVGPPLGGWLVAVASWHWIFLINIPVGLAAIAATFLYMEDSRLKVARFDAIGYLMLAFTMMAVSLALDGLAELSLRRATILVMFIFGMATFVAYWLHATRVPHPLFPPGLFANHTFRVGILGNLFSRLGTGGMPFLIPLVLQVSLGYDALQSGMAMIPVAIAGLLARQLAVPLVTRLGYRKVLVGNTVLVGLSMASFVFISPGQAEWLRIAQFSLFGAFNSLQFTAMNTVTLKDLDTQHASAGNSLLSMVMTLSMSLGVACSSLLLAIFTGTGHEAGLAALPSFQWSFLSVGLITAASALIFWQLAPDDRDTPALPHAEVA